MLYLKCKLFFFTIQIVAHKVAMYVGQNRGNCT